MKTINDQPQELLALYADRKGAKFELYMERFDIWREPVLEHETPQWCLDNRFLIRLVLTHGLPSHLPPYKENPRDPGEGYRVPACGETSNQPFEYWHLDDYRKVTVKGDLTFNNYSGDYRLPATVMPPDWEEMTKEVAVQTQMPEEPILVPKWIHEALDKAGAPTHHPINPGCAMPKPMMPCERINWLGEKAKDQNPVWKTIADEAGLILDEVRRLLGGIDTVALEDIIQVLESKLKLPTIGVLRPISEMPDEVPAGCVRMYASVKDGMLGSSLTTSCFSGDTHAADIQLPAPPDPLAEERAAFEAWYDSTTDHSRPTSSISKESHWATWMAAKGL